MHYNARTDYLVSRELAHNWWRGLPESDFVILAAESMDAPAKPARESAGHGPWVVLTPQRTDVAGVVVLELADRPGQWGLAVLWYDGGSLSGLTRFLRGQKLARSREAAKVVGKLVLAQGGTVFPSAPAAATP